MSPLLVFVFLSLSTPSLCDCRKETEPLRLSIEVNLQTQRIRKGASGNYQYAIAQLLHQQKDAGTITITPELSTSLEAVMTLNDASQKCPYRPNATLSAGTILINANVVDIRKNVVMSLYAKHFGYDYRVDPISFKGLLVQKSNMNAHHSIKLVKGPLKTEQINNEAFVYQKLLNDIHNGSRVEYEVWAFRVSPSDFEFFAIRSQFPPGQALDLSYVVAQEIHSVPLEEIFPGKLKDNAISLLNDMCIDFARIDVVNDQGSGLPIIVDINDTPTMRPRSKKFASHLAKLFDTTLHRWNQYVCSNGITKCKPVFGAHELCSNTTSRSIPGLEPRVVRIISSFPVQL